MLNETFSVIFKHSYTYLKYIDGVEDDSISACQLHQNKGTNKQKKWFKSRWFSQFM